MKSDHSPGFSESMHLLEELNNDGFQKLKHKALWGHPLNISYFYKEPKKFSGGELIFPSFDYSLTCKNNSIIIIPYI